MEAETRKVRKGGSRGGKSRRGGNPRSNDSANNNAADMNVVEDAKEKKNPEVDIAPIESDLCLICAEPVKFYAFSECNHRTCHVCALRLRALYKKENCTFCKVIIIS